MENGNILFNKIPFERGSLETLIERIYKTMDAMDREWSKKVEPASQSQIQALAEILKQHGRSIPLAYLLFLQAMGKNDNGLLEQEWDGDSEVNIDTVLENYDKYYDFFDDFSTGEFLPFSTHWTDAVLSLKLTGEDNPPVYYEELFSGSFENYLFQMAFRRVENTQFLYQVHCATSKTGFRDILSEKSAQNTPLTTPMEFIESILKPYQLQKAWFSDEVRFCGISSEYIISVDLHWALNIKISSDSHKVLQDMKCSLTHLFGSLAHW